MAQQPEQEQSVVKPYEDWTEATREAFKTVVDEITRASTMQGQLVIFMIAMCRVLVERGVMRVEEILEWLPAANQDGLGILGVSVTTSEPTAEERYATEGLPVWDGKTKGRG